MIDEKKIKEAATKYAGKRPKDLLSTERQSSFKDGAEWAQEEFVKSLWHDASEEPKSNKEIITLTKYYGAEALNLSGVFDWEYIAHLHNIIRWAYLDDILPKEGGEE